MNEDSETNAVASAIPKCSNTTGERKIVRKLGSEGEPVVEPCGFVTFSISSSDAL